MKGLELIEKYPLTGKIVKDWFMKEMINSFKDETVPTEFKDFMLEQGIDDDKIGTLIDVNPRMLLDVFDENDIIIQTLLHPNKTFTCIIGEKDPSQVFSKTRKEAELSAIEKAFEILENQLSPKEEEIN